jgi:hypothetical protein
VYLLYGQWLALWAVGGILFAGRGTLRRRGRAVLLWSAAGLVLAGGFGARRLAAEFHWSRARDLEGEGDPDAAADALRAAVAVFPELQQLERTWLLLGKLDYQAGRHTLQERFFRAFQIERDKGLPRAVAYSEDLPWTIKRTADYRTGLTSSPAGFYTSAKPDSAEVATPYAHERLASLQGPLVKEYLLSITQQPMRAIALMEDLLAEAGDEALPVRRQAARFLTNQGLQFYLDRPILSDSEFSYFTHDRRLTAAQRAWRRAAELMPANRDCAFYLGIALARSNRDRPDLVEAEFGPMAADLADRALRGEILDILGDAYFEAGWLTEARQRYAASYDVFSLPKRPNIRAQRKLGGL